MEIEGHILHLIFNFYTHNISMFTNALGTKSLSTQRILN